MSTTSIKINSLRTEYDFLRPCTDTSLISLDNSTLSSQLNNQNMLEGALDYLSRIYAHWWKREIKTPQYALNWVQKSSAGHMYILPEYKWDGKENGYIGTQYCDYYYARKTVDYGDQLTINSAGEIQKNRNWNSYTILCKYNMGYDKTSVTPSDSNIPRVNYLYLDGKYYRASFNRLTPNTSLYTIVSTGRFTQDGWTLSLSGGNSATYEINSTIDHVDTITDYVFSFNRNTYPDSRTSGQYTYTYLGVPFENARGG